MINLNKDIKSKKQFKAFIVGASIGYLARKLKYEERCKPKSERLKGSSNHNFGKHLPSHYPIACKYLTNKFSI